MSTTSAYRIEVDGLVIDRLAREAEVDGVRVRLTARPFDLLVLLASDPRRVFTRAEISESLYGIDISRSTRVIDAHAHRLRKELGDRFVLGMKRVGYRLLRDVTL
jgi:DNA-binding response OmpR family regulator